MDKNSYHSTEEEYSELRSLLKNLPEIEAPENFEYVLLTKIKNGNFELKTEKKSVSSRWFIWAIGPATAVALSVVLFFFVFDVSSLDQENPFLINPQVRENVAVTAHAPAAEKKSAAEKTGKAAVQKEAAMQNYYVVVRPNDVVVKEKDPYPFNPQRNLNVDNYFGMQSAGSNGALRTVGAGASQFDFNGFSIPVRRGTKEFEQIKSRIDSLKNIENKESGK
ncbi:MAG: hypothetical protein GXO87_08400 [Chlorobi bacterium]|nr:hypothetical protein [Chlorobiota bacterium]